MEGVDDEPLICQFAGQEWEDMGGGMQTCSECFAAPVLTRVACLLCGAEGHPSNMRRVLLPASRWGL